MEKGAGKGLGSLHGVVGACRLAIYVVGSGGEVVSHLVGRILWR